MGWPITTAIRIVIKEMSDYVPTALVALTVEDAERLCDKLNKRLGLTREDWIKDFRAK